ncbi:hypothetical protein BJX76DRAFT_216298 [Aspergillus varians]
MLSWLTIKFSSQAVLGFTIPLLAMGIVRTPECTPPSHEGWNNPPEEHEPTTAYYTVKWSVVHYGALVLARICSCRLAVVHDFGLVISRPEVDIPPQSQNLP